VALNKKVFGMLSLEHFPRICFCIFLVCKVFLAGMQRKIICGMIVKFKTISIYGNALNIHKSYMYMNCSLVLVIITTTIILMACYGLMPAFVNNIMTKISILSLLMIN
jgi:hypothetical protein